MLWAAMGVLPIVFAVPGLRLAAGVTGVPGTLTVVSCAALGEGRYDCRGSFAPASGGPAVPVRASPDSTAGDVLPARLAPGGDRAVPAGAAGVLAALALPGVGVAGLGFLPYVIVYWYGGRRGRKAAAVFGWVLTAAGVMMTALALTAG
ncbi:hypothetical protein Misp01_03470 [Microtetraspora sp. NBRC 13810]|nr:hypothetical protein Misp01_03470 [Microtetraspora sp. NBRC 13810]